MIGIPTKEEQQKMTIKIKQEKINEDTPKYTYETPTKSKLRQTNLHGNIINMTVTPTPQKRKKEEINRQSSKSSTGNDKKKSKPVHLITPKRMIMDRDKETTTNKDNIQDIISEAALTNNTNEQVPKTQKNNNTPTKQPTNTPTKTNKDDQLTTDKPKKDTVTTNTPNNTKLHNKQNNQNVNNRNNNQPKITNPYKTTNPQTTTSANPKVSNTMAPVTYAAALSSPQKNLLPIRSNEVPTIIGMKSHGSMKMILQLTNKRWHNYLQSYKTYSNEHKK